MTDEVNAYFVDFDGTLANSLPALYVVYHRFLKEQGCQGSKEEFVSLLGPSLPEVVQSLIDKHDLEVSLDDLSRQYYRLIYEAYCNDVDLMPGAQEFLHEMAQQGKRVLIVSSAPKDLIDGFLKGKELESLVETVVGPEGLAASKPDPEIYLRALEIADIGAEKACAIEDTQAGVQASTGAGIATLLIGERDVEDCPLLLGRFADWHEICCWMAEAPHG